MSSRLLKILGSSSQLPTRARSHNAYFLRWDETGILIDPGEGAQRQMLLFDVPPSAVDFIFISHFHGDHCLGLPGVLQRLSLANVLHPVRVFYPAVGQAYFERLRYCSAYFDQLDLIPTPFAEEGIIFQNSQFSLSVRKLEHVEESWGFQLRESDGFSLLLARLEERGIFGSDRKRLLKDGQFETDAGIVKITEVSTPRLGQRFAYISDTLPCAGAEYLAKEADLLLCEATYLESELALAREYGHLTARKAGELAKRAGVRRLALTHFSQRYTDTFQHLLEAAAVFPEVTAVEDGMEIPLPPRRSSC